VIESNVTVRAADWQITGKSALRDDSYPYDDS
jgi:hypothetical protein